MKNFEGERMSNMIRFVANLAFLVLLVPTALAFTVTDVTTNGPTTSVTTGTDVTISTTLTADQNGNANEISLTGSGQGTGSTLTISDPATGSFTGTSITSSGTTVSFVVSAGVVDTYDYSVTATYTGGAKSSTVSTLSVVSPSALSVSGSVNTSSNTVGADVLVTVTLTNPTASSVTTSYALTFQDANAFTVLSGDSKSGTITLDAGGTNTFSYVLDAAAATTNTQVRFGIGSNSAAFAQSMTTTSPPGASTPTPASGGGSTPTPSPSAVASVAPTSSPSLPAPTPKATTGTGEEVVASQSRSIGLSTAVTGSFGVSSATFEVVYKAPESGFLGDLTYAIPLVFADYQAGLISFDPEPSQVRAGSILATWPVDLGPGELFTATVNVAKAVDQSVLNDFKAPSLAPKSTSTARPPVATEAPASTPAPTPAPDYTLWYVVGALVLLGVGYFALMGRSGRKK